MPFKVQVGPLQISIDQGQTVLVSEPSGQISSPSEKGLYFFDTRILSSWMIYANGEPWDLLNGGAITYYASRIYLANRRISTADGVIPARNLPAAGLPWFATPFRRDRPIVSRQNMLIYPDFARGSFDILGSLQAKVDDDYRDAEPGKIAHEMRYGGLAYFKLIPHTRYYGTADATQLYLIALHAAWRAAGDGALLERHIETAEGCLSWIDTCGLRDGDGFQEYQSRSPVGYDNMGWKDSGDSVVYPDGSLVRGPKALCELQGYVYDARLRMAEMFDALGKPGRAEQLRAKAATRFKRVNEVFWDEELGF
jgi:glycogen debranching enzyme